MPRHARGFDTEAAHAHLLKRDRKLATWMRRIGPLAPDPRWRKTFDPVDALARAILYQQLSGKAAATIVGRVEAAIGNDRFHCDTLGRIDDAALRACGVSGNKALALRDLALRESRGEIPDLRRMSTMDDAAIIAALVPVRGIGRWTVEMMLMFRLGRPDILPVDDLGIRKGAQSVAAPGVDADAEGAGRNAASAGARTAPTPACICGRSPTWPDPLVSRPVARRSDPGRSQNRVDMQWGMIGAQTYGRCAMQTQRKSGLRSGSTMWMTTAALVLALSAGAAFSSPSNKWRIQVSSDSDTDGVVVFHLAPVGEPAVDVTVPVPKGASENHVADLIRDAMRARLGDSYRIEVDDGEDVLVKKHLGAKNFDLTIKQQTVKGVRITLDKE